jgi:hypothetical protein
VILGIEGQGGRVPFVEMCRSGWLGCWLEGGVRAVGVSAAVLVRG